MSNKLDRGKEQRKCENKEAMPIINNKNNMIKTMDNKKVAILITGIKMAKNIISFMEVKKILSMIFSRNSRKHLGINSKIVKRISHMVGLISMIL